MFGYEHPRPRRRADHTLTTSTSCRALGGIVDYVGRLASPGPACSCSRTQRRPEAAALPELYKLGEGPLYSFYTPYHLCHFEVPLTVARAVLFHDAVIAPSAATARGGGGHGQAGSQGRRDHRRHRRLHDVRPMRERRCGQTERLLPMGLAEGCQLIRDLPRDAVVSYDDITLPRDRYSDRLRAEQDAYFAIAAQPA